MFNDVESLLEYISLNAHTERRECEFKGGLAWEDLQLQITKGVLALSNLQGGGYVIIGVTKNRETNQHEPTGLQESDSRTYDHDQVSEFVNNFADPHVDIELKHFFDGSKYFVVIQVFEFEEIPVICKRETTGIFKGRIYCRSHRKMESSPELSVSELREIIELAVDKGIVKLRRRPGFHEVDESDPFNNERNEF